MFYECLGQLESNGSLIVVGRLSNRTVRILQLIIRDKHQQNDCMLIQLYENELEDLKKILETF